MALWRILFFLPICFGALTYNRETFIYLTVNGTARSLQLVPATQDTFIGNINCVSTQENSIKGANTVLSPSFLSSDDPGVLLLSFAVHLPTDVPQFEAINIGVLSRASGRVVTFSRNNLTVPFDKVQTSGTYTLEFFLNATTTGGESHYNRFNANTNWKLRFQYTACPVQSSSNTVVALSGDQSSIDGVDAVEQAEGQKDNGNEFVIMVTAIPGGILLLVAIIAIIAFLALRKKKRMNTQPEISNPGAPVQTGPPLPPRDNALSRTSVLMGFSSNEIELPEIASYKKISFFDDKNIFGAPLDRAKKNSQGIPEIVAECVDYLEAKGLNEVGILRLTGSSSEAKILKDMFNQAMVPNFSAVQDVNSVCDVLKSYFRMLPSRPLMMTKGLKEAAVCKERETVVSLLRDELYAIPELNFLTLDRLFRFLRKVAENSEKNKMMPENIAIVFHPTLQIPKDIIVAFINYPEIFA
eukprot:TRINITY_DN3224_c0_g1_i1.p1 TRINITY_DN3224_c0_g1~~TRINITY_DN3224_c0_g1_i1.p1  ORF type:complete len:469 (-),score=84.96 TRINITY_DN3224_c0_g1_i1:72-1478(-)